MRPVFLLAFWRITVYREDIHVFGPVFLACKMNASVSGKGAKQRNYRSRHVKMSRLFVFNYHG